MSETALATTKDQKPARLVVQNRTLALDTAMFEQIQRVAMAMASASLIPDHLVAGPWWDPKRKASPAEVKQWREQLGAESFDRSLQQARERTAANCFLVAEQSFRWGMSPFAVAPETYEVGGKLAFQGKLIHAVVNELAGLETRLRFEHHGEGKNRGIKIWGRFIGDTEDSVDDWATVERCKTEKNAMWVKDPDQKLLYTGVLHWARRFAPEVVLGIRTVEDLETEEERTARPPVPSLPVGGSSLDALANARVAPSMVAAPDPTYSDASAPTPQPAPADASVPAQVDTAPADTAPAPAAAASEPQDATAAPPADGSGLSDDQVTTLVKLAGSLGVPWSVLESFNDGPIAVGCKWPGKSAIELQNLMIHHLHEKGREVRDSKKTAGGRKVGG